MLCLKLPVVLFWFCIFHVASCAWNHQVVSDFGMNCTTCYINYVYFAFNREILHFFFALPVPHAMHKGKQTFCWCCCYNLWLSWCTYYNLITTWLQSCYNLWLCIFNAWGLTPARCRKVKKAGYLWVLPIEKLATETPAAVTLTVVDGEIIAIIATITTFGCTGCNDWFEIKDFTTDFKPKT